jgi:hypothetical protein
MKNKNIYLLAVLCIGLAFNSCDINTEERQVLSTPVDSFESTNQSITIDGEGVTFEVVVAASEAHTQDRNVPIEISSKSIGNRLDYDFSGSVDIVAGQLTGSTMVKFDFNNIASNVLQTLVLKLMSNQDEITISYTKTCESNEIKLAIIFDFFPEETSWQITDSTNTIVESGGTYPGELEFNASYELPDGNYTFTIFDVYSDGICCGFGQGSYILEKPDCSEIFIESGQFGDSESTTFSLP